MQPQASKPSEAQVQTLLHKGLALHQKGQLTQAQELYQQVLKLEPRHFDALHLLGVIAAQTKNFTQAVELIGKALEVNPRHAMAYNNHGSALRDLKQPQAAIESYDKAIALKPDHAEVYFNRGNALGDLAQHQAAIESYDQAIALKADFAEAYNSRGTAWWDLKQPQAALESYDKAIEFNADHAEAYNNRGTAQIVLKQPRAALESYNKAIALQADFAEAYNNRGNALSILKQHQAALESYDKAIALKADYASAHFNQSLCLLQMGNFELGWKKYEWRWKDKTLDKPVHHFTQPAWLGTEPLQGKTILLHSEQGLGDTIQFCRYAKLVHGLGAQVILEVQEPLLGLLAGLDGVAQLVARGAALPAFDYHCPLLSLPLAFKTNLSNIPTAGGYLAALPDKVTQWQARLGPKTKPRVGLVWSGSKGHKNDHNRSFLLSELLKFLPPDLEYLSLQKEVREADRETLERHPQIVQLGEEIKDFTDTAALCALVDVLVSADTSVVHLAGAMGRPAWVLLPFNPDWRWLLDRNDSPWYSSARLYRQDSMGDWGGVFERLRADLSLLIR